MKAIDTTGYAAPYATNLGGSSADWRYAQSLEVRDSGYVAVPASRWEQVVAGDGAVFAGFYERHADRVYAHCYSRLASRVDAEDLTAQVFELAWRHRSRVHVDDEADILPWLLATANNLVSAHHRATVKAWRLVRRLSVIEVEPDHAATLADREELDQELALVRAALGDLRPADREVIELCVMHGLSPAAAATATGVPASTVRTRLSRALVRARRAYRLAALRTEDAVRSEVTE